MAIKRGHTYFGGLDTKHAKRFITYNGKRYEWYMWVRNKKDQAGLVHAKEMERGKSVARRGSCNRDNGIGWNYYSR